MSKQPIQSAFVLSGSPFADLKFQEGLDAAFAFAAFDQRVALIFVDDSVWALHKRNQLELSGNRDFIKQLGALAIYDIEDVYIARASLAQRGLTSDDVKIDATLLEDNQVAQLLQTADQVFRF